MCPNLLKGMRILSHAFDSMFSITQWSITEAYDHICEAESSSDDCIMELGSGIRTYGYNHNDLILADIDFQALKANTSSNKKLLFDANCCFPLKGNSIDHIHSRFTFEHLHNTGSTIEECSRILKSNGRLLILFSSRNAEFSILNRMLPDALKSMLSGILPNSEMEKHGYIAYYDHCTMKAIKTLLKKNDLFIVKQMHHYFSAPYFDFFPPLYFLVLLYEEILSIIDRENMASYVLIEAIRD